MPLTTDEVAMRVDLVVQAFTGRKISREERGQYVGRDLGINGEDSMDFYDEIEKSFAIDLKQLIDNHSFTQESAGIRRTFGMSGHKVSDFTVIDLIDYIVDQSSR